MSVLLSLIIPIYNVEKFVEKCILSCEQQDIEKSDYEIVCVNDGSIDNSLQIVERLAEEYSNIKVISQANGGLSSARNTGMRHSHGRYYMFVDSDDWIATNCLGRITKKLICESPDVLAICAANMLNGHAIRRQSYLNETPITGKEFIKLGIQHNAWLSIWSADFIKRNNFSFFEGIFHEDSELTPRAYYVAEKVSLCNDIIYYVYQNPDSIMRSVNPKKSFDLIKVVCPHLSQFAETVDKEYKAIYYNNIAILFNNAMNFILSSDDNYQTELNNTIVEYRFLYKDLAKSTIIKYRIEALLLSIFPKHPLFIYKIMKTFN